MSWNKLVQKFRNSPQTVRITNDSIVFVWRKKLYKFKRFSVPAGFNTTTSVKHFYNQKIAFMQLKNRWRFIAWISIK